MWYAASYAEFVNQKIYNVTEEERKGELLMNLFFVLHFSYLFITQIRNVKVFCLWSSLSLVPSVLREQEKNWPCYECNRRFVSSEQLQQHLNMHDDKLNSVTRQNFFLHLILHFPLLFISHQSPK